MSADPTSTSQANARDGRHTTHGGNDDSEEDGGLERALTKAWPQITRFLDHLHSVTPPSIYSSADIRDAVAKTVAVDTNAFPAGFNNLCRQSRKEAAERLSHHLGQYHPQARRVLLLPEDHTRNPHYIHNVHHLMGILHAAGLEHHVGSTDPEVVANVQGTADPEGHTLAYDLVICKDGRLHAGGQGVDLVISNNDFTSGVPDTLKRCNTPIIPDPELGWSQRSKAKHFRLYNHIATHVAHLAHIDAAALTIDTEHHGPVDFKKREGLSELARAVDRMLARSAAANARLGIDTEPRVFMKDDTGTYGMGISVVASGDEVHAMNSRARQKMDKGKYGHKVHHVILQEAVPTRQTVAGRAAESVIYLVGAQPIGAFLRMHPERGGLDNLNAPGMRFLPVCAHAECPHDAADPRVQEDLPRRAQLAARIAAAALAHEAAPAVSRAANAAAVPLPALGATHPAG